MKKYIIIVIINYLLLSGCSISRPRTVNTVFIDYRPYVEQGFFISPNPYPGVFIPVGEMYIKVVPGNGDIVKRTTRRNDPIYVTKYQQESINSEAILDIAVNEAKTRGANGIANLECKVFYKQNYPNIVDYYTISGFCIIVQ